MCALLSVYLHRQEVGTSIRLLAFSASRTTSNILSSNGGYKSYNKRTLGRTRQSFAVHHGWQSFKQWLKVGKHSNILGRRSCEKWQGEKFQLIPTWQLKGQCTVPFLDGLGYGLRLHTTMQLPTKPELNSPGSRLCVWREPRRSQGPAHNIHLMYHVLCAHILRFEPVLGEEITR